MGDPVKEVIAEWVLTNGSLPGFQQKVFDTHTSWDRIGPEGLTVYRGQGGKIENVSGELPSSLKIGVRPVLATSVSPASVVPYAGADCCIFRIKLLEGTRILGVKKTVTNAEDAEALYIKKDILTKVAKRCKPESWTGRWPNPSTPYGLLKEAVLNRCAAEDEIMVYFMEGTVSDPVQASDTIEGKLVYDVTYTPSTKGGRRCGRTFRTKTLRRNKHGSRFTRQSKHRLRNRHA
jgi:hypothetical protein